MALPDPFTRWSLSILSFFGFMWLYALRFNLSQAMVAMTGNATLKRENETVWAPAEFDWSKEEQGIIQSSFFYGYTAMALPGGWLAGRFGGKLVIGVAMLINSILCILTPFAASAGISMLILLRVVQGFAQAPVYPSMHRLWGKWAPQAEVGPLTGVSYSGPYIGNIMAYILGGYLSVHGFGAHNGQTYSGSNWPSIFYVFGAGAFLWVVLWFFLSFESPKVHPWIHPQERTYIEANVKPTVEEPYRLLDMLPVVACAPSEVRADCRVPWRAILLSKPMWAINFSLFTFDYGMYMLMTNGPEYLKEVHNQKIFDTGLYTALPFLAMWIVTVLAGLFLGLEIVKDNLSFTAQRKLVNTIGSIIPAVFLVLTGYSSSTTLAVVFITLSAGLSGMQMVGAGVNHLDLAPRYADVLMGFSNFWASIGGILAPYFTAALTENKTAAEWRLVFFITAGLVIVGAVSYAIFGSGKRQWWADGDPPVNLLDEEQQLVCQSPDGNGTDPEA